LNEMLNGKLTVPDVELFDITVRILTFWVKSSICLSNGEEEDILVQKCLFERQIQLFCRMFSIEKVCEWFSDIFWHFNFQRKGLF
jgi:hypothetical protein